MAVHVVAPNAIETTYEVMTDRDGHPAAAIEVISSSDIMILSKDEQIAQLQIAARAVDFAIEHRVKLFAKPMLDSLGACREGGEGSERLRFNYQNLNTPTQDVLVPISGLSPAYYLNPLTPTDDLLLNDIRSTGNELIVPDDQLHTTSSGTSYQLFQAEQGSFTVSYDLRKGPLTWNFIGKSMIVDDTVQLCEARAQPRCSSIPNKTLKTIYREYIKTVRNTLKDGAKSLKRGTQREFNTTPYAVKTLKSLVKLITQLRGVYVCEPGAIVPQSCQLKDFPHTKLLKLHAGLFKKVKLINPKAFEQVRLKHHQLFNSYLAANFPSKVHMCPSP